MTRLFVVNSGSLLSALEVDLIYRNSVGVTTSAPIAVVSGTGSWQPTLPLAVLANVTSLEVAANDTTEIWLRFRPQGASSGWRIDDLYVDPFKRGGPTCDRRSGATRVADVRMPERAVS